MKRIIQFQISKGQDGFYVASADREAIYTQGKTFEELFRNIREAVEVSLDDLFHGQKPKQKALPPIMMNMDFSEISYA